MNLFIMMMLNSSFWLVNISVIILGGRFITLIGEYISDKAQEANVSIWGANVAKQGANVAIRGANLSCPKLYEPLLFGPRDMNTKYLYLLDLKHRQLRFTFSTHSMPSSWHEYDDFPNPNLPLHLPHSHPYNTLRHLLPPYPPFHTRSRSHPPSSIYR